MTFELRKSKSICSLSLLINHTFIKYIFLFDLSVFFNLNFILLALLVNGKNLSTNELKKQNFQIKNKT
jgi:hypothetical protein